MKENIIEPEQTLDTSQLKFYSHHSILIATLLGGPLAAGVMVRENYLALEDYKNGRKALLSGIVALLLLSVLTFIPETALERIPNFIIPIVITIITSQIVEKFQGSMLSRHKANGYSFYSIWTALGISLISLLFSIIIISILVLPFIPSYPF